MTVRLPLGISRIFRIRAAVPTRYRSSGPGCSTSGSFCKTAPIMPPEASTSRTRRIERCLPTVIGVIDPGKSTELRRVRIGSVSGTSAFSPASSSSFATMGMTWCLPSSMSEIPERSSSLNCFLSLLIVVFSLIDLTNVVFFCVKRRFYGDYTG